MKSGPMRFKKSVFRTVDTLDTSGAHALAQRVEVPAATYLYVY